MKGNFIGLKRVTGKTKDGQDFDFTNAMFTTELSDRDVKNGAIGTDVHVCSVPDEFKEVLCNENVGKKVEVSFFYMNHRENLRYVTLSK
jgi:hypothetical protein